MNLHRHLLLMHCMYFTKNKKKNIFLFIVVDLMKKVKSKKRKFTINTFISQK